MHGHCIVFLLCPCSVWLPFQPPLHFAATCLKFIGGEQGAGPRQVGHRASVPEKTILAGGCISILEECVAELVFVEVSTIPRCTNYLFHGLHCGFNFAIALRVSSCELDICETPLSGKVTELL